MPLTPDERAIRAAVIAETRRARNEYARMHPRARGQHGARPGPGMAPTAQEHETAAAQAGAMRLLYATMSELEWQRAVEELLTLGQWQYIHLRDSRRQRATGWPDLFAVKGNTVIAIELKTQRGRVTPAQSRWLALLRDAGMPTYVWRPAQIDEVRRSLLGDWTPFGKSEQQSAFTGPYYASETSHER